MRNAAIAVLREIGVDTGGSNVQFAVNPADGRLVIIEMNPRVSRSSALASKATGFPDRQDRRQAGGRLHARRARQRDHPRHAGLVRADDRLHRHQDAALHLREISRRRAAADDLDEIGRRGDGDRPQLCRIGAEGAALDGDRARPASTRSRSRGSRAAGKDAVRAALAKPVARPPAADRAGLSARAHHRRDPRRLPVRAVVPRADPRDRRGRGASAARRAAAGPHGVPAAEADGLFRCAGSASSRASTRRRSRRGAGALELHPVYKRIDTCAAEFPSLTSYMYSCYEGDGVDAAGMRGRSERPRAR